MLNELEYWARVKVLGDAGLFEKDNWRMAFDIDHPGYTGELNWLFATPLSRALWEGIRRVVQRQRIHPGD